MKSQLISAMRNFVLGGGTGVAVALAGLSMWTGTTDLEQIKHAVEQLDRQADSQLEGFIANYTVAVDNANAEIGEYKQALEQANSNISQLITAYEQKEQQAEQDLADLQLELASMEDRLNAQYEADMNAVVEAANEQIDTANNEVAETKDYVDGVLQNSNTNVTVEDRIADTGKVLDTGNDKTVTDISAIIGEVEGE